MVSTVTIYGTILETINETYRFVSCESGDPLHNDSTYFKVPLIHWSHSKGMNNTLMSVPEGKKVIIKGRLSSNNDYPLLVVVEYISVL